MFQKKEATHDAAFYMIGSSGLDGFPVFELQLKKGRIVGGGFFGGHIPDFCATPTTLNKTNTSQRFKKEIEHYLRTEETGAKYEDFQRLLKRPELPRDYKSAIEQLCF